MTFTKTLEYRIRRILEIATAVGGILTIIFSTCAAEYAIGCAALLLAYKGLVEDLPRVGALVSKRRFWE